MTDELKQEIDAFLEDFDTSQPTEPGEETDEVVEETSEETSEETTEETEEQPEEPSEETPAEPEEELDELSSLKKQNELLQQRLNEAYQHKPVKAETAVAADPLKTDFFGEWKFDDIVESQESLQKFLGEFAGKVVTVARESVLKDLPGTVSNLTTQQIEARRQVDGFYGDHPQLTSVKPFVAQVVSTVASEHADWELPQVLEEAAQRAYKALGLKQQVEKAGKKNPAFAPTKPGGPRGKLAEGGKSKLEKELEELM